MHLIKCVKNKIGVCCGKETAEKKEGRAAVDSVKMCVCVVAKDVRSALCVHSI